MILSKYKDRKIKFANLKYLLVNKEYNRIKNSMEKSLIPPKNIELINQLKMANEKGKIDKKLYSGFMDILKEDSLRKLNKELIPENEKLGSESSLRDKINELLELKMIEKKSDSEGYPYYIITDFGMVNYSRYNVHSFIDSSIMDKEINDFYSMMVKWTFKKRGIKLH
jgi:hypothetical protein